MISVNAVNKWVFSRPDVYELFDDSPTPFTNAVDAPVYPINQIPESDSPYTVFTWKTRKSPSHFTMNIDEIVYWIWDHNIARLQDYESVLRKYLGQEDESAQATSLEQIHSLAVQWRRHRHSNALGTLSWFQ